MKHIEFHPPQDSIHHSLKFSADQDPMKYMHLSPSQEGFYLFNILKCNHDVKKKMRLILTMITPFQSQSE